MNNDDGFVRIEGGVWEAPGVDEQPLMRLSRWTVFEVNGGSRHLVGWNLLDREGRVSSAIEGIDAGRTAIVTSSGRRYELVGPAGSQADAAWVWGCWCEARGIVQTIDVSTEYGWLVRGAER